MPLAVDGSAGHVGPVQLGGTLAEVLARLGPPVEDSRGGGFAPAGKLPSDVEADGGSISIPGPPVSPEILRYRHLAVMVVQDRVFAMVTDDAGARTPKGVGVGDPLGTVRASYRKAATCIPESSGGEFRSPAHCAVAVPAGHLSFGGDPIKSIELIAGRRYTGGSAHAVYLRRQDSAAYAGVQCTAKSTMAVPYLLCRRQPAAIRGYEVVVRQDRILVYKIGNPVPVFTVPND